MKISTRKITAQEMLNRGITKYVFVNVGIVKASMLITMVAVFGIMGTMRAVHVQAEKEKCLLFVTHKNAQVVYESDPKYYKALDRDHDGQACENLP